MTKEDYLKEIEKGFGGQIVSDVFKPLVDGFALALESTEKMVDARWRAAVDDVLGRFKDPLYDNGFGLDPEKEWELLDAVEKTLLSRMGAQEDA